MEIKAYQGKAKNKRVIIAYDKNKESFYFQFKKLKDKTEKVNETPLSCPASVVVHKNILVVTTIILSKEIGLILYENYKSLYRDILHEELTSL